MSRALVGHKLRAGDRRGERLRLAAGDEGVAIAPQDERGRRDRACLRRRRGFEEALERRRPDPSGRLAALIDEDVEEGRRQRPRQRALQELAGEGRVDRVPQLPHPLEKLGDGRFLAQAPRRADQHHAEGPLGMVEGEALRDVAAARRPGDQRRLEPDGVHEPGYVAAEVLEPVPRRRPVGIAVTALRRHERVDGRGEVPEQALEVPARLDVGVEEHDRNAGLVTLLHVRQRRPAGKLG